MLLETTFLQSVALIAITALLTGFLAPFVVQWASRRRLKEQRRFEEELERETAFVEAQTEFLKELATAAWDFLERALAVSYAAHLSSPERFEKAWDAYDEESFALFGGV